MRIEARTMQRQEQRLLPSMLQSIEVLQLATADLLELVAQEVAENEVLDVAPARPMEERALGTGTVDAVNRDKVFQKLEKIMATVKVAPESPKAQEQVAKQTTTEPAKDSTKESAKAEAPAKTEAKAEQTNQNQQ